MNAQSVRFQAPDMPLEDGVVLVRPVDGRDRVAFLAADRVADIVAAFGSAPGNEVAFHEHRWQEGTAAAFAICVDDSTVGVVLMQAGPQRRADIGYWVLPQARGCGYAARATALVAAWALTTMNVARVQLWAASTNTGSQRVAAASGFQREGVFRSFTEDSDGNRLDAVFYSLIPTDISESG